MTSRIELAANRAALDKAYDLLTKAAITAADAYGEAVRLREDAEDAEKRAAKALEMYETRWRNHEEVKAIYRQGLEPK